jgi:hypothetical protein
MIIIWSFVVLIVGAILAGLRVSHIDAFLNIPLSILIYSIGYMGLKQPEIFLDSSSIIPQGDGYGKYRRSGLRFFLYSTSFFLLNKNCWIYGTENSTEYRLIRWDQTTKPMG